MRTYLDRWIVETNDLGRFPESDAALKAANVTAARIQVPPSETNFTAAFLSGPLEECEAAAVAFAQAVVEDSVRDGPVGELPDRAPGGEVVGEGRGAALHLRGVVLGEAQGDELHGWMMEGDGPDRDALFAESLQRPGPGARRGAGGVAQAR